MVSFVTLEYGGGDSSTLNYGCGPIDNDALLLITHWVPDVGLLQSCTFAHSASGAIVSGWVGNGPDLRGNNTFLDIAEPCQVTQPTPPSNGCPSDRLTPDCY